MIPPAIKITSQPIRSDLPSPPVSAGSHSNILRISIPNLILHDLDFRMDTPPSPAIPSPNSQSSSPPSPGIDESVFRKLAEWTIDSAPSSPSRTTDSDSEMHDASSGNSDSPRIAHPLSPGYLGFIPASQITQKLAECGHLYLYHSATADAFVRSIPIATRSELVRVKIIPRNRDRRPFYIQKQFPPQKLRPSVEHFRENQEQEEQEAFPIHIEYALYKSPLLAAVLLSGHVRKGDTLLLPMPYPRFWRNVVEWIYRGGELDSRAAANLEYFGCRI